MSLYLTNERSRRGSARHRVSAVLEALEERQLFSLIGIGAELGLPATSIGPLAPAGSSINYSAATHAMTITGVPISMILASSTVPVSSPSGFTLTLTVDNSGNASSSATPTLDMTMTGTVNTGATTYTGTLLTGTLNIAAPQGGFGFSAGAGGGTGVDNFDFQFQVTGGQLAAPFFTGSDIGVTLSDENSNFVDFSHDFSASPVKGFVGSVPTVGAPPISISGFKYQDMSGNGLSADDAAHPIAGVTIQLYTDSDSNGKLDSGDALVTSQPTAADGSYAFTHLTAGTYFVKEVTPAGYLQTGPVSGTYTVNATSGNYTGLNFDNFKVEQCNVTNLCYTINGCKTVHDISGQLHEGDTVKVTFTIDSPETITFVSYTAPDPFFNANDASQQQIFDVQTGVYSKAGTYSLTIKVPNCYFQVDLVCGLPIDKLGPAGSNIFYTPQQRIHDSDNGGVHPCMPAPAPKGSIAGSVYLDCNNDGIRENGETGLAGVTITLTGTAGGHSVSYTTTTDSNGNYKFSNLDAGTYKVTETDPSAYADGMDTAGSLGGSAGNDVISNIVLAAGANGVNYNFGELQNSSVCGSAGRGCCEVQISGCDSKGRSVCYTVSCDQNGNFSCGNLACGNYTVRQCDSRGRVTQNGYSKSFCVASSDQGKCVDLTKSNSVNSLFAMLSSWMNYFS